MKGFLVAMLLAASAFAQEPSTVAASACGPDSSSFQVKLDDSQHGPAQPDAAKALVYFIQEKGSDFFAVTTRSGSTECGLERTKIVPILPCPSRRESIMCVLACNPLAAILPGSCISPQRQDRFITSMGG